jgi:hypothetical protein
MPPLHHRVVEAIESLDKGISLSATIPTLIVLRIDDKPGVGTTDRDPVQIRETIYARRRRSQGSEVGLRIPEGDRAIRSA